VAKKNHPPKAELASQCLDVFGKGVEVNLRPVVDRGGAPVAPKVGVNDLREGGRACFEERF
jgi:hypothetical protein